MSFGANVDSLHILSGAGRPQNVPFAKAGHDMKGRAADPDSLRVVPLGLGGPRAKTLHSLNEQRFRASVSE